jgi:hypothetical protein
MALAVSEQNKYTLTFSLVSTEHLKLFCVFHTQKKLIFGLLAVFWLNSIQASHYFQEIMSKNSWNLLWRSVVYQHK